MINTINGKAKPFIKWVGGKGKILPILRENLPDMSEIKNYVEPFVGGGSFMFDITARYNFEQIIINDINSRLIKTYEMIKYLPDELLNKLEELQNQWYSKEEEEKKEMFYSLRDEFNSISDENLINNSLGVASLFIFLNKTCFNGLYRVNSKNEFNVPCGRYEHPKILDTDTILVDSKVLKDTSICNTDYNNILLNNNSTLYYMDPPYAPISKTSAFTDYSTDTVNDEWFRNLKKYCDRINETGSKFILSNSHPEDNYFEDMFKEYNIKIINAPRAVAAKSESRKKVEEVLITNF